MAHSLAERITSARKSNSVRIADLEKLIGEAEAERLRLTEAVAIAEAESVDFALCDDDRDTAAARAARHARASTAMNSAIADLRDKLAERQESDRQKALRAEKAAAIEERDRVAARVATEWPEILDKAIALFDAIEASDSQMKAAGVNEPCAEAVGRGLDGFLFWQMKRITQVNLPALKVGETAWPRPAPAPVFFDYGASLEEARQDQERREAAKIKRAEERARNHGTYRISATKGGFDSPARLPWNVVKHHENVLPRGVYGDTSQEVVDVVNATADLNRRTADLNNATARLVQLMNGGGGSSSGGTSGSANRSRQAATRPEEQGSSREDQEEHQRAVRKAREADELEAERIRNQKLEEQRSAENLRNRNKEEAEILHRARLEAEEAAQRVREDNVRDLADIYQTLFTDGVGGVWRKFKQEGLAAIATIAAQWTIAMATGQGSTNIGGLFNEVLGKGGLFSSLGGLFGGARATGGPVAQGKAYLVGERGPELFMPQGNGTIIPNQSLTSPAQASPGVATVRLVLSGDIDARIDQRSAGVAVQVVRASAGEIVDTAAKETVRRLGRRTL